MRARVLCRLLVPTARTGAWLPAAAAAALGAAAFAATADHAGSVAQTTIAPLRVAAVVAGLGAGFVIDDPAEMSPGVPGRALTLEAAAMVVLSLGAAAGVGRFMALTHGGVAGAGAVLVLAAIAILPTDGPLLFLPGPQHPRWEASHLRWAALAGVGVAVFVAASRDPARR